MVGFTVVVVPGRGRHWAHLRRCGLHWSLKRQRLSGASLVCGRPRQDVDFFEPYRIEHWRPKMPTNCEPALAGANDGISTAKGNFSSH